MKRDIPMPTENRSSNTEMVSAPLQREERYVVIKISKMHPHPTFRAKHLSALKREHEDALVDCVVVERDWPEYEPTWAAIEARVTGKPAPQPRAEPIAWMVGTAFWWTKEEAERDAAATGKPMTPFGPMTGTYTPAEQHQGEPVAVLYANGTVLTKAECGDVFDICCKVETPLYTHADHGEVERLKSIERSYGLREELLEQVKGERDRMIARTMELSGQLNERDALLRKIEGYHWAKVDPEERAKTRAELRDMLTASADPSAPAAPYPNRLCHIDYTAHPYRCGCLRGDEESQRIYDEHCRKASAEPEAKS
ncbi:hypothetical protein ACIP1G_27875 [Pseudomonas sp. NPDC089392]|uniref:hypothetical protein n=1 Tax=Pseudomonas sp. NPDC089392 TaxID=3364459 RepID=UPI0038161396